jgi:hypothetical protein
MGEYDIDLYRDGVLLYIIKSVNRKNLLFRYKDRLTFFERFTTTTLRARRRRHSSR